MEAATKNVKRRCDYSEASQERHFLDARGVKRKRDGAS